MAVKTTDVLQATARTTTLRTDEDFELDIRTFTFNTTVPTDGVTNTCPQVSYCITCEGDYSCYGTCTVENC